MLQTDLMVCGLEVVLLCVCVSSKKNTKPLSISNNHHLTEKAWRLTDN